MYQILLWTGRLKSWAGFQQRLWCFQSLSTLMKTERDREREREREKCFLSDQRNTGNYKLTNRQKLNQRFMLELPVCSRLLLLLLVYRCTKEKLRTEPSRVHSNLTRWTLMVLQQKHPSGPKIIYCRSNRDVSKTPRTSNKIDYESFYQAFWICGGFILLKHSIN